MPGLIGRVDVLRYRGWIAAALLASVMLGSLCIGPYPISPSKVLRILGSLVLMQNMEPSAHWSVTDQIVVQAVRLPRVLLATITGAGLGLTGATLQGVFQNPLVGPDIIGVSAGAACGSALGLMLGLSLYEVAGIGFLGGLLAVVCVVALARLARGAKIAFILAGVIVAAFFSAILSFIEFIADPQTGLSQIIHWLMGSFAGATTFSVAIAGVPAFLAGGLLLALRWRINLLSLGQTEARSLGVRTGRLRGIVIAASALIVATQVSVSGIIGWVGLIVPHLARMVVGPDHRRLLPASTMIGAIFMLVVDDLARSISSQEMPIGLITAFVGTPIFAWLFYRSQMKDWTGD